VKKIKRKLHLLFIAILAISILIVPTVNACKQRSDYNKVPASAVNDPKPIEVCPAPNIREIGDHIVIYRGGSAKFAVTLTIDGVDYKGTSNTGPRVAIENSKTNTLLTISPNAVWTFSEGTFEGKIIMKISNYPGTSAASWHVKLIYCTLYGNMGFEGQKLVLSYDGPQIGAVWTGYLIEH
jgi:hypothetical protein